MAEQDEERGRTLLALARGRLEELLGDRAPREAPAEAWLDEPGAVFVTLTIGGELRGCIGSLEPTRPLRDDVRANAEAAATRDPRFPALGPAELPRVRLEVSLLEPSRPIEACDEATARAALEPGVDGVILEHPSGRGTFLPQVWEQLPEPADFLRQLKRKAGLPAEGWDERIRLFRYRVRKWSEEEPCP